MAVDNACSNRLPSLKLVGDTLPLSVLISPVTLTFDLLTSNLLRVIALRVGNLPTNFDYFWIFMFSCNGPTPDRPDLLTLTFDLGGHGTCRRYGSSFSNCLPSYKFVGLSIRKI